MTVAELVEQLETRMQQSSSTVVILLGGHEFDVVSVERYTDAVWDGIGQTQDSGQLALRIRDRA